MHTLDLSLLDNRGAVALAQIEVSGQIDKIKSNKLLGPDGEYLRILQECKNEVAKLLTAITHFLESATELDVLEGKKFTYHPQKFCLILK